MFKKLRKEILLLLILFSQWACMTLPTAIDFQPTILLGSPIPKTIFVERVVLPEDTRDRDKVEVLMTQSVVQHIKNFGVFARVEPATKLMEKDKNYQTLSFRFKEYRKERNMHPAYAPFTLITFGFYLLFGGPIVVEVSAYDGALEAKDEKNHVVFRTEAAFYNERNGNLYSKPEEHGLGMVDKVERTEWIDKMLNAYADFLRGKKSK